MRKGSHHLPKSILKLSHSLLGNSNARGNLGRKQPPEEIARRAAANRKAWKDPVRLEKQRALASNRRHSKATKSKISQIVKKAWKTEERRTKGMGHLASPEKRKKLASKAKQQWESSPLPLHERPILLAVAQTNAKRPLNTFEKKVAACLRQLGVHYCAQKICSIYVMDFFLQKFSVNLECDGTYWHSLPEIIAKDKRRTIFLKSRGIRVIRLKEADSGSNLQASVIRLLKKAGVLR